MKQIKPKVYILIIIVLLCVISYLLKKTTTTNIIKQADKGEKVINQSENNNNNSLNIPPKYFSNKDLQWSDSINVAYKNIAVYQSYPTLETKIKNYENLSQEMVNRTMEDIRKELNSKQVETDNNTSPSEDIDLNPFDFWRSFNRIEDSYAKYGKLNMNYYPDKYIEFMETYDVDDDGNKESIVILNYTYAADSGSTSTDIIKNGKIIFSINESQSKIVQAETNNGFYVEWRIPNDQSPHCCEAGFMRTRFVYEDHIFKPLYEQEVRYIKVGTENDQPINIEE